MRAVRVVVCTVDVRVTRYVGRPDAGGGEQLVGLLESRAIVE